MQTANFYAVQAAHGTTPSTPMPTLDKHQCYAVPFIISGILPLLCKVLMGWWFAGGERSSFLQPHHPRLSFRSLAQMPTQPLSPQGLEWLHIPKTGTSFGNTLILWACPELDPTQVWMRANGSTMPDSCRAKFRLPGSTGKVKLSPHKSLTRRTDDQLRRVVTMLRFPPTWTVSLYHHGRASDAKFYQQTQYQPLENTTEADVCSWLETSKRWSPDRHGCMVKMIAGVPRPLNRELRTNMFLDSMPPTPAMTAEACRRVGLFAFVGITDYWDASICLFHAMHGGPMQPAELQNVRPGRHQGAGLKEVSCVSDHDMQLYGCAFRLFRQRLATHPHCMKHLPSAAKPAFQLSAAGRPQESRQ